MRETSLSGYQIHLTMQYPVTHPRWPDFGRVSQLDTLSACKIEIPDIKMKIRTSFTTLVFSRKKQMISMC